MFHGSFERLKKAVSRLSSEEISSEFEIIPKFTLVHLKEFAERRDLQVAGRPLFGKVEAVEDPEFEIRVKGRPPEILRKLERELEAKRKLAPEKGLAFLEGNERVCQWHIYWKVIAEATRGTDLPGPFVVEDCAWALLAIEVLVAERIELICDAGHALRKPIQFKEPTLDKNVVFAFDGILSEGEIRQWAEATLEKRVRQWELEAELVADFLGERGKEIRLRREQMADFGWEAKAKVYQEIIHPLIEDLV